MIKYLITTFSILWFCNSPKEPIHFAILTAIISFIATHWCERYYIDTRYLNEVENEVEEEDENDN